MTRLVGAAHTDIGQVRAVNQDSALAEPGLGLFVVADGMGGHLGGEVASALAIETLLGGIRDRGAGERVPIASTEWLVEAVLSANERVHDEGRSNPELHGMGTTLCAVALVGTGPAQQLAVVNVGDSRVYLLRDGELEQLTEDHSLVQELVRRGQLTPEEAAGHPMRNVVTRVIGVDGDVEVDWWERSADPGDRYLLCSDGLFNEVTEARIAATLRSLADPDEAARTLVALANDGGGRDNITCVVVDVHEGAGPDGSAGDGADTGQHTTGRHDTGGHATGHPADRSDTAVSTPPPALGAGPTAAIALAAELGPAPPTDPVPVPAPPAARPPLVTGRVVGFVALVGAVLAGAAVAVWLFTGRGAVTPQPAVTGPTATLITSGRAATTVAVGNPQATAPQASAPQASAPAVTASPSAAPTPAAGATPSTPST